MIERDGRTVSMPRASSPMFLVKGRRPVETRTTSAASTEAAPPPEGSTVSFTPSAVTSEDTTFVDSWNFTPCFFNI